MSDDETWRKPLWMYWWEFKAWFHRCPECGNRPDKAFDSIGPRWEDDKIAQMLGIGQYGCRRCGHGSIEQRDAAELVTHEFDPGYTGLSEVCNALVERDGYGDTCGLPRARHVALSKGHGSYDGGDLDEDGGATHGADNGR